MARVRRKTYRREQATGQFCNYACLSAYIEEEALTTGACCRLEV
ncbi:hypothetical protein [Haladaptatus sp. NG-WS-4]